MKILLVLPLVLAGLSGCAVYPAYGYRGGHVRVEPVVIVQPAPVLVRPAYRSGDRYDRNRSGLPDRYSRDRDRDGDGVPDRYDSRPYDPRYR